MSKIESKKEQKYHAKTLGEMFASIKRGQEYVTVVMQRAAWEEVKWAIETALREEDKYMATKKNIMAPAIKEKKTGIVMEAPSKAWAHDQIEAAEHKKKNKVKEGFVTNGDKFVGRKKAAKIAKKAKQIKDKDIKKLHSSDLRKTLGIKKKKLK